MFEGELWAGAEHSQPMSGDRVVHTTAFTVGGGYQRPPYTLMVSPSLTSCSTGDRAGQNSPSPAETPSVSLLPPVQMHLGDCGTERVNGMKRTGKESRGRGTKEPHSLPVTCVCLSGSLNVCY